MKVEVEDGIVVLAFILAAVLVIVSLATVYNLLAPALCAAEAVGL